MMLLGFFFRSRLASEESLCLKKRDVKVPPKSDDTFFSDHDPWRIAVGYFCSQKSWTLKLLRVTAAHSVNG